MHNACVADLAPRLGAHYLFAHRCACEHLLVFTDCALRDAEGGSSAAFPRTISRMRFRRRPCCVCRVLPARLRVLGDVFSDTNPAFYCERCHALLHGRGGGDSAAVALSSGTGLTLPYCHDVQPH